MDQQGFRQKLQSLGLTPDQVEASMSMTERFDAYLQEPGRTPSAETAAAFSRWLIQEGLNTEANYLALARYCRFIKNDEMFITMLEAIDGGEVVENLYRKVGERFGFEFRDAIFAGIPVAPYGTSIEEKPAYLHPVLERLRARVGDGACAEFLSPSLRDLPDEYYARDREMYQQAGGIDAYLRQRKEVFLATLEQCQREGRLFYVQAITGEVLDFVRRDPEMGGGRREGNIVYETKIPYMIQQYLAETDPVMRRFHYCHCPWARAAIKNGNVRLVEQFCYCSGGYMKKPFEVIFEKPLRVEVLESVLRGDDRCRFAIYLPEEALPGEDVPAQI